MDELVVRNRNLENFSYSISHNLRGPIATLLGIAEIIGYPDVSIEEKLELLKEINRLVKITDETIRDINEILKIQNDKKGYSNVNLEEIAKNIILSNNSAINSENIKIYYVYLIFKTK